MQVHFRAMLTPAIEVLDRLISAQRPVSEIKPHLITLRDQAEALEAAHAALKTSHADLETKHAESKVAHAQELARLANDHSKLKDAHTEAIARLNQRAQEMPTTITDQQDAFPMPRAKVQWQAFEPKSDDPTQGY
jgi:peptidoglycan hydrolase CwlO-like protein